MIDFHQHSTFSDGTDNVEQLIKNNIDAGIKYMSITDHDNFNSAKYISEVLKNNININYTTGIEFSADYENDSTHILAYGFNLNNAAINNLVDEGTKLRKARVFDRITILEKEFNIKLTPQMLEQINNASHPGRPMIANFLIELGYGNNVHEVIQKYLYHKLPQNKLDAVYTLQQINTSSAISVWAHPLGGVGEKRIDKTVFEKRLQTFVNAGLKGLECYYSLYSTEEQEYLVELAKKHNLLISAGSDYHGTNKTVKIGELSNNGTKPQPKDVTIVTKLFKTGDNLWF